MAPRLGGLAPAAAAGGVRTKEVPWLLTQTL